MCSCIFFILTAINWLINSFSMMTPNFRAMHALATTLENNHKIPSYSGTFSDKFQDKVRYDIKEIRFNVFISKWNANDSWRPIRKRKWMKPIFIEGGHLISSLKFVPAESFPRSHCFKMKIKLKRISLLIT